MSYSALSAFVVDQILGYQTMNTVRLNNLAAIGMRAHSFLGGDDVNGLLTASYADVTSRVPVYLDGTNTGGLTRQARIQYRTSNAATSVTWRVQNVTDSPNTTLAQGAASTSTSIVEEVVSITPGSGEAEYRLQVVGGNATNPIFAWGHLEQYG